MPLLTYHSWPFSCLQPLHQARNVQPFRYASSTVKRFKRLPVTSSFQKKTSTAATTTKNTYLLISPTIYTSFIRLLCTVISVINKRTKEIQRVGRFQKKTFEWVFSFFPLSPQSHHPTPLDGTLFKSEPTSSEFATILPHNKTRLCTTSEVASALFCRVFLLSSGNLWAFPMQSHIACV